MPLILLIDDDDDVRTAFSLALRRRGHRVAEATNGRDALALLEGGLRPTLILLDSEMPLLDGAGFRAAQLANPALARIPVLLVTADREVAEHPSTLRPVGVLRKPVGFLAFLAAVEDALERADTPRYAHA